MDISQLAPAEALAAITAMETVEQLREAATSVGVKFSGNTGEGTLRTKLYDYLTDKMDASIEPTQADQLSFLGSDEPVEEIQIAKIPSKPKGPTVEEMLEMDPTKIEDTFLRRQVIRLQALRLVRVRITNLDPADAQLNGAIITTYNKYTSKVAKYIPFGEESENGYHVPKILLDDIKNRKFPLRKEVKGGSFGVKKYKTTMVNKFAVEELPYLSPKELADLAAHQRASHAIDN